MENIEQIIKQQHDYFKTLKTHEYAFRMKQLTLLYQKIKYYQKEIEEDIQRAHPYIHKAGQPDTAAAPQDAGIEGRGQRKGKKGTHDAKIGACVGPDGGIGAQHGGEKLPQNDCDHGQRQAEQDIEQNSLAQDGPAVAVPPGSQILCHLHGKAHGSCVDDAVEQPYRAGHHADGGSGLVAQRAYHGGIDVAHQGGYQLLQNSGQRQGNDQTDLVFTGNGCSGAHGGAHLLHGHKGDSFLRVMGQISNPALS